MRSTRLLLVCLLGLAVAACGSGDDGSGESTTTAEAVAEATTSTTEPAVETTEAADPVDESTSSTDGTSDDLDAGDLGVDGVCVEASQAMAAALGAYTTGFAGAFDGALEDQSLEDAAAQLEAMASAAPAEIRDDLEVIAGEMQAFYAALAESGYEPGSTPTPEMMAELAEFGEVIDQAAFDAAADNVEVWFNENC